jgi:hypothetical protein
MSRILLTAAALLGFAGLAGTAHALPDPTETHVFSCLRTVNLVWNDGSGTGNVSGRVYRPSTFENGACTTNWPAERLPLVVLAHGNGYAHTAYSYLAHHLALNGFVVATVNTGNLTDAWDRADKLITYTHGMYNFWADGIHLTNQVGLVGHSRGGEGVAAMAVRSKQQGRPWSVQAVVALAPTDAESPGIRLSLNATPALLVLHGTHDGDVVGRCTGGNPHPFCAGAAPTSDPGTGFSLYDRAGSIGLNSVVPGHWITKAMVSMAGGTHGCFSDQALPLFEGRGTLSCNAVRDVTAGYVNAFLRWQINNDPWQDWFDGTQTLPAVTANGVSVQQQFEGSFPRVLDDFETGTILVNNLGGPVNVVNVDMVEGPMWALDSQSPANGRHFSVPHDDTGSRIAWDGPAFLLKAVHWGVPFAQRNVTGFGFLSLRAAQMYSSLLNNTGATDFRIYLVDIAGNSASVDASSYGGVAQPDPFTLMTLEGTSGIVGGDYSKTTLATLRIPLTDFAGVDLANIDHVSLTFGNGGHPTGEILLDDLMFSD